MLEKCEAKIAAQKATIEQRDKQIADMQKATLTEKAEQIARGDGRRAGEETWLRAEKLRSDRLVSRFKS